MDEINAKDKLHDILSLGTQLSEINDVDILLEEILLQARIVLQADAGSIYVCENNDLAIQHAQNATKEAELSPHEKLIYNYFKIPIDSSTISGYCVVSQNIVVVDDAYQIPGDAPYSFNKDFDHKSSYRTRSVIAIPLIASNSSVLGVIQLINKLDQHHKPIKFDNEDLLLLKHFSTYASAAMQRAQMTRTLLLRMMKMAELRDPKETHSHVNRVASYATELYERWAKSHKTDKKTIQKNKDILRMAAMLHDVGKVAISDTILKKPGLFTPQEFEIIKTHTYLGARLFDSSHSEFDDAARIVSLNHHENWDGTGYPGHIDCETSKILISNQDGTAVGKREQEIPLFGRIVAVCDVYDALRSPRAYKKDWDIDKTLTEMRRMSGKKFDPELLDMFMKILPNIKVLEKRYHEEPQE